MRVLIFERLRKFRGMWDVGRLRDYGVVGVRGRCHA